MGAITGGAYEGLATLVLRTKRVLQGWQRVQAGLCKGLVRYDDHTFLVLILRLDDSKLPIESERTHSSPSSSTAPFCKCMGQVLVG